MKRIPVESAFLATLVVMTGCGQSASPEFVDFKQTAPSELDREQEIKDEGKSGADSVEVAPVSSSKVESAVSDSAVAQSSPVSENKGTAAAATAASELPTSANAETPPDKSPDATKAGSGTDAAITDNATVNASGAGEKFVVSKQSGLTGPADNPVIDNAAEGEQREIQLLIPDKHFRKELGQAFRVTYDDLDLLKVLNMEPVPADAVSHFPAWLSELDGKPVRIRGFMFPTFSATDLTEFVLARDNGICCFVRKPKVYDIIGVTLADGEKTDYIEGRPFDVQGILRIDPAVDQNSLSRLYRIEQAKVLH